MNLWGGKGRRKKRGHYEDKENKRRSFQTLFLLPEKGTEPGEEGERKSVAHLRTPQGSPFSTLAQSASKLVRRREGEEKGSRVEKGKDATSTKISWESPLPACMYPLCDP